MITASAILYALGVVLTMRYLLALMADIPREELSAAQFVLAAVLVVAMALVWPVFWGWLLYDMWRE